MNRTFIYIMTVLLLMFPFRLIAQLLKEGNYIGYEKIDVRLVDGGILRYWPGMNTPNPQNFRNQLWFHQVTMRINKDSVTISKVPVEIKNGQLVYSDSIGGFFYYKGEVIRREDSSIAILSSLTLRKYTGIGHGGCGIPFYIIACYNNVITSGDSLSAYTRNLGNLIFKKVDQMPVTWCLPQSWLTKQ